MKLHEYQAKALLSMYGMLVPRGGLAATPAEARQVAERLGRPCVVKAQVYAGGRGKAGGIRMVQTPEEAEAAAASLLGTRLVTPQTGPGGAPVHRVLVEETLEIERELYLGVLIDGGVESVVVIASRAGGVNIETVAQEHPELVLRQVVDPVVGFQGFQGRRLAVDMGLPALMARSLARQMVAMYEVFIAKDCSLVEINPLVITKDGRPVVLDAKISVDDDALFRHEDLAALRDWDQLDPLEAKAGRAGIAYVKLDGDVGCLMNGAGMAMATMDAIKAAGLEPANFLDVGGAGDAERVAKAMSILLEDPSVKRVLVNIFGGIARCDDIARGIIQAVSPGQRNVPFVVRLLGTNLEEGKALFRASGLNVRFADTLLEAIEALKGAAVRAR
ncbi:MAG: ADP-forming succinate--CoA ligase subunit beta [Chloroflexi bacterium]|nr:ADP-forming succinate--CoA ligase subunit beta [Chloroflexota bacterium]